MRKQKIKTLYRRHKPPVPPPPVFLKLPGEKKYRLLVDPEKTLTRKEIAKRHGTMRKIDDWRPRGTDLDALELDEFCSYMHLFGGLIKWHEDPDEGVVVDVELD